MSESIGHRVDSPVVSIGMPVYNGAEHLREALDSLLSQTFENFELIISDNASTDGTELIGREYAERDSRVQYFRQDENIGAMDNFNWVFNKANRGKHYMWAACDDRWHPNFIMSLNDLLLNDPGVELAFCLFETFANDRSTKGIFYDLRHLDIENRYKRARHFIWTEEKGGKANPIYGIYRRKTLEALGGAKQWGVSDWGADMVFVFSIILKGKLKIKNEKLFYKRVVSPNTLQERSNKRLKSVQCKKMIHKTKIDKATRRIDYWDGYSRAIASLGPFNRLHVFLLKAMIFIRSFKYYRKKIEHTILFKLYILLSD